MHTTYTHPLRKGSPTHCDSLCVGEPPVRPSAGLGLVGPLTGEEPV